MDKDAMKLYILEEGANYISIWDISGSTPPTAPETTIICGSATEAFWMDFDKNEMYYLGANGDVNKYTLAGPSCDLNFITGLESPGGITVDGSGNIYVSQGGSANMVSKFESGGDHVEDYNGGLNNPADLLARGTIYLADTGNGRVAELSGGDFVDSFAVPGLSEPTYLNESSDGDELLLTEHASGNRKVWILTTDGSVVYELSDASLTDPHGSDAYELPDGARVYLVADKTAGKIVRFTFRENENGPRQVWEDFRTAMGAGGATPDFTLARTYMHPFSREWFDGYITELGPHAPKLADRLSLGSELKLKWVNEVAAEFYVFFEMDIFGTGPKLYGAQVRFVRDDNGDWKIFRF